jgi:hypothetical protein
MINLDAMFFEGFVSGDMGKKGIGEGGEADWAKGRGYHFS